MVNKSEFHQWKSHPVYQDLFKSLTDNMAIMATELVNREYPNDIRDTYVRGIIAGFRAVLDWEPEFAPEEGEPDEV